jgi:hypothetical protein
VTHIRFLVIAFVLPTIGCSDPLSSMQGALYGSGYGDDEPIDAGPFDGSTTATADAPEVRQCYCICAAVTDGKDLCYKYSDKYPDWCGRWAVPVGELDEASCGAFAGNDCTAQRTNGDTGELGTTYECKWTPI